jgi:DNA-binding transcriptional LysR family regulator
MDSLAGMRLFMRVVQAGSFSAAGRQIGLSPASVFRAINALEDMLGARLLNRSSRKLTLTEAGELYSAKLEQILGEIDDTHAEVTQLQLAPRGTLRIHTRVSLGIHHLAPLLPVFLAQYAELKIDLRLSDTPIDLAEENIDVDIRVGEVTGSSFLIQKLGSSPRLLCASPAYLARHAPVRLPEDLKIHNCLTFRSDENQPMWRFLRGTELTELRISGSLQADHGDVLREAALAGLGVVLLPAWSVEADLLAGRLVPLLLEYEATPFGFDHDLYVVTHKARHRSLKVRLFLSFLVKAFRERQDWGTIKQRLSEKYR